MLAVGGNTSVIDGRLNIDGEFNLVGVRVPYMAHRIVAGAYDPLRVVREKGACDRIGMGL